MFSLLMYVVFIIMIWFVAILLAVSHIDERVISMCIFDRIPYNAPGSYYTPNQNSASPPCRLHVPCTSSDTLTKITTNISQSLK